MLDPHNGAGSTSSKIYMTHIICVLQINTLYYLVIEITQGQRQNKREGNKKYHITKMFFSTSKTLAHDRENNSIISQ